MNRQILLKSRPAAMPATENFSLVERPIPEPAARRVAGAASVAVARPLHARAA